VRGNAQRSSEAARPTSNIQHPTSTLRFFLHESDDPEDDRRRLDELIALIERHPGNDHVRLFVHARDGDRIELSMPDAIASDELREAGIAVLTPHGGADAIAAPEPALAVPSH
jgi:hypothetical protein